MHVVIRQMLLWLLRIFILIKNNFLFIQRRFDAGIFKTSKTAYKNINCRIDHNELLIQEKWLLRFLNNLLIQGRYMEAGLLSEFFAYFGHLRSDFRIIEVRARAGLFHQSGWKVSFGMMHLQNATSQQLGLHAANLLTIYCRSVLVEWCLEVSGANEDPQHHLALANACEVAGDKQWLANLNSYLSFHSFNNLLCQPIDSDCFLGLAANFTQSPSQSFQSDSIAPLVSVCMACYNAEKFVEVAVRSILNQTHRNIELLLFDDCSSDSTLQVLRHLAGEDERIVLIGNRVNQGTYASRNQALQRARGEFFTVLDADDFALPKRLAMQILHMQENTHHIGVMTHWVRMHPNGRFHFRSGWGGVYQHPAVATLMVRTSEVRETVGYWDCVRFSADTEYLHRLYKVWGRKNCPTLKLPTVIALFHENSLTNHPVTGINSNGVEEYSGARLSYRNNWSYWHKNSKSLYLPYHQTERKFPAPPEMLI